MTEAFGGFWQGVNNDPVFVPLDEFISNQLLADLENDANAASTELVLETEGR